MNHRRFLPTTAAALLLVASLTHSQPAIAGAAVPAVGTPSRTVTLITGDRVSLTAGGGISVMPRAGRADIPMLTSTVSGHVRVVPADALPLLRAGRLDPRLFDVTGLLADGYTDRRTDLPIIASTAAASRRRRAHDDRRQGPRTAYPQAGPGQTVVHGEPQRGHREDLAGRDRPLQWCRGHPADRGPGRLAGRHHR
jgi:hypothetical protein